MGRLTPVLALVLLCLATATATANRVHSWSQGFGDSLTVAGVACDGVGNVVVTGTAYGIANFGGGPLSGSGFNVFVAAFTPAGTHIWSKRFAGAGQIQATSVAADAAGNVVITGLFAGSVDFGGGALVSAGQQDVYLAKFDPTGAHLWSKRFGDAQSQVGNDVAVDATGNVILAGTFDSKIDLGGGALTSFGLSDVFLAKFDGSGVHQWSKRFGLNTPQRAHSVAVDAAGRIALLGDVEGGIDLGGGLLTSAGSRDVFVGEFDAAGSHLWSHIFGDAAAQPGTVSVENHMCVACDPSGNVAIGGGFAGSIDFGGGAMVAGGPDGFVASFSPAGVHRWSHHLVSMIAGGIGADASGNVFITGGSSTGPFLHGFDTLGAVICTLNFAATSGARDLAVDPADAVLLTGTFRGSIDFGGGPIAGASYDRIYLAKFVEEGPLPVAFQHFEAIAKGTAVEVRWNLWSDESLDRFTLYRTDAPQQPPRAVAEGSVSIGARVFVDRSVVPGATYTYELVVTSTDGSVFRSPTATATLPMAANSLIGNIPNPFNPTTSIIYSLASPGRAVIGVYDAGGALVKRLDDGIQGSGQHAIEWNGRDAAGRQVASGVYFYRLEGTASATPRKMVLLK